MDIKNMVSPIMGSAPPAPAKYVSKNDTTTTEQTKSKEAFPGEVQATKLEQEDAVSKSKLDQMVGKVNDLFQVEHRKLSFSVNQTTQGIVVEVRDTETDEVIRQIPPEYVVKLAEQLQDMSTDDAVGMLLKDKA